MAKITSKSETRQVDMVKLLTSLPRLIGLMIIISTLIIVTQLRLDKLSSDKEAQAWRQGFVSTADRTKQLDCLAKNIYYEAGSEPFEGKVAVAQVTLNRVQDGRFGSGVCGVVYQKNVIMEKVICQFSWYCEGAGRAKPVYPALWDESYEVAKKVLLENFRLGSVKDALYFHNDQVSPGWSNMQTLAKIGRHTFYKKKGDNI
jgi:spore germination cell wall hydrolase CwlJ-like protein